MYVPSRCVALANERNDDMVQRCQEATQALTACMTQHPDYYSMGDDDDEGSADDDAAVDTPVAKTTSAAKTTNSTAATSPA